MRAISGDLKSEEAVFHFEFNPDLTNTSVLAGLAPVRHCCSPHCRHHIPRT